MELKREGKYRFKHDAHLDSESLIYVGTNWSGRWHQFRKESETEIWCELLDSDLHLIEEIK